MIVAYSRGDGAATNYEIAWVTMALQHLRVWDDSWARMDPAHLDAHRRLWTDVTRRAQPGYAGAPASLLALASWQPGHGSMHVWPPRDGKQQHGPAEWPPRSSTTRHGFAAGCRFYLLV